MKDVYEVLRQKETLLAQVAREVEALRIAVHLLAEEGDADASNSASTLTARQAAESDFGAARSSIKEFP
jgi:hypothetical protein